MTKRTPEGAILKAVTDYLTHKRIFWLRLNTEGQYDARLGAYRPSPYTRRGTADLLVISEGHPVFVELKAPKGRLSADQVLFRSHCESYGIEYEVVRSLDELIQLGFKR
jgi:hypothetical protein